MAGLTLDFLDNLLILMFYLGLLLYFSKLDV